MRVLTGLNFAAFDQLLPSFSAAYTAAHPISPKHQRAPHRGRKATLEEMEEKLFFVRFYFKYYPTFDLAGIFFDCLGARSLGKVNSPGSYRFDRSQANCWLHRLQPFLEAALGRIGIAPTSTAQHG